MRNARGNTPQLVQPSKSSKPSKWNPVQLLFLTAIVIGYIGAIMPVALGPALLPALEEDKELKWGKKTSGLFLFSRQFFESFGHLALAFVADIYGGRRIFTIYKMSAATLLFVFATVHLHSVMFTSLILVALLKGTALPAVVHMIGWHLDPHQWDISFILVGCSSRLGNSFTPLLFGFLIKSMTWEYAASFISLVVVLFALIFNVMMDLKEDKSEKFFPARGMAILPQEENRFANFAEQVNVLFSRADTWLIMGTMFGSFFVWSFGDYLATFAHNIYGASLSQAAAVSSAYPSGQLFGLIVSGIMLVSTPPGKGRRVLYTTAALSLFAAFGIVTFQFFVPIGPRTFALLAFCLGALGVQISYVPSGVFAVNESRSGRSGSALSAGTLEGMVGICTGSFAMYISYIREHWSEYAALQAVLVSIIVGLTVSIPCFCAYVWRNWNGPLFTAHGQSDEVSDDEDNSSTIGSSSSEPYNTSSATRRDARTASP